MELRSVVNSDGRLYPSISAAARSVSKAASAILTAAQATRHGLKRTAGGLQWAYVDEVPEVWPVKRPRKRKELPPRAVKLAPDPLDESLICALDYTEIGWRIIPGFLEFEVSSFRSVRRVNTTSLVSRIERQGVSLVRIQDRLYSIVDLMMLAFVGPKPYGYTVQRLEGESEVLSNLCYAPRKPRKRTRNDTRKT